ncbi:MAG TPA: DUF2304 family protein [Verrucomicrobiae bacterium]|nr:DUF2304 family protein [Verrucomicrobiae bacterium]
MLLIQVLIVLFAGFAFMRVVVRLRRQMIGRGEFFVWACFWAAVAALVLTPRATQWFARVLGVGRGADAVFYLAIVGLSYLNFRLEFKLRTLQQQITQLVRKLALEKADQK